jgi:hypothetical protein
MVEPKTRIRGRDRSERVWHVERKLRPVNASIDDLSVKGAFGADTGCEMNVCWTLLTRGRYCTPSATSSAMTVTECFGRRSANALPASMESRSGRRASCARKLVLAMRLAAVSTTRSARVRTAAPRTRTSKERSCVRSVFTSFRTIFRRSVERDTTASRTGTPRPSDVLSNVGPGDFRPHVLRRGGQRRSGARGRAARRRPGGGSPG